MAKQLASDLGISITRAKRMISRGPRRYQQDTQPLIREWIVIEERIYEWTNQGDWIWTRTLTSPESGPEAYDLATPVEDGHRLARGSDYYHPHNISLISEIVASMLPNLRENT